MGETTPSDSVAEKQWPELVDDACLLVGHFMRSWSHLEYTVAWLIEKLATTDIAAGFILSANMDVRGKIQAAKSLVDVSGRKKDANFRTDAVAVFNRISKLSEKRNVVAHSPFEPRRGGVEFERVVAKSSLNVDGEIWSKEDFKEFIAQMELLCHLLSWIAWHLDATILSDFPEPSTADQNLLELRRRLMPPPLRP